MHASLRILAPVLSASLFIVALGCSPPSTSETDSPIAEPFAFEMLGRWDVSESGEDPYPHWFELRQTGGALQGTMQPDGGHALELESIVATGDRLEMTLEGTTYVGTFANGQWTGTATASDGTSLEWTAVRAPRLPAPTDPKWGEPIELFNGVDLTGWHTHPASAPNQWMAEDGVLINPESGANLVTDDSFDNFKLHIEVNVPEGSNSGIYLRGRYEVQVLADGGVEPPERNMGGLYGRIPTATNASKAGGEWQTFDITLLGRWVTVVLNGTTVIDHQEIAGPTGGALDANESEPGPFYLQGDHGPVQYRNIVVTPML